MLKGLVLAAILIVVSLIMGRVKKKEQTMKDEAGKKDEI